MLKSLRTSLLWLIITLAAGLNVNAQELLLEDFRLDMSDLTARLQPHKDRNGDDCALILISTGIANIQVQGDLGGAEAEYKLGSLFVWVPEGAKSLTFTHSQFPRLEFDFPIEIKGLQVYKATLKGVYPADEPRLIVSVIPAEAYVEIDGKPVKNDNGTVNIPNEKGTHSYTVRATGYETATGTWNCEGVGVETQIVSLKQTYSTLEINTYPETDVKLYIQDKYVGTTPWPKNDEERKQAQFVPGMYRVRAEKESIFPIDTSIFISELGKTYKERINTQQRWSGSYKYDYWPLTVLVGLGWTTYKTSKFGSGFGDLYGGNVDVTLRHWLHHKPLPDKLRFAIDYQLQCSYNRSRYIGKDGCRALDLYNIGNASYSIKDMFTGSITIGPSLTWTPTRRDFGQFSVYIHLGYHIGGGNGLAYYYGEGNYSTSKIDKYSSKGFASSVGLSFTFRKIGIAGEYVIHHQNIKGNLIPNYERETDFWDNGLRVKLFVKIGK